MKVRRSARRGGPLTHRFRRSRSPLMTEKRKQRPQVRPNRSSGRRKPSRERPHDYPLRRSDHGKELVHNHSPPRQHRYRSLSPLSSARDDDFRFQHNYILADHPSFNPSWKPSQAIKDREFHTQINMALPPSSQDIEEQGMLLQKSTFFGEGSSRSLYSDLPMGTSVLSSERLRSTGGSFGMEIQNSGILSHHEGLTYPYDDMDRRHAHFRDLSTPKMPPSQLRQFSNTSSSSILKDFKGSHHDRISDGLATGIGIYPNDPLEHYAYNHVPLPDSLRHDLLDESHVHDYDKLHRRGLDDHRHRVQDKLSKKMPRASRTEFRNANSSTVYTGGWMGKTDSPNRNLIERKFSDHHRSFYRDTSPDYHDVRDRKELLTYSDNWHGGLRIKSSPDYETMPSEEGFTSEKAFFPISHRVEHRNRRSSLSDHDLDEYRLVRSTQDRARMDDLSDYDVERMERSKYATSKDIDENRIVFMNDQHSFAPYGNEEMWLTKEPARFSLSKSIFVEHSQHRNFSCGISSSDAFMPSRDASSMHAESDHNINLKRRLKQAHSDFHSSSFPERRRDLLKSYKYGKRGMQDRLGAQGRGTHDSGAHFVKNDPPEDSEEFKQQVHKSFLRYSKLLNESLHNQRIYQIQGNTFSLLCSVCGSASKEFVDTNSLVTHSYHSLKVGLKTEHLGFHKALCVLLGWNWRVPPDNSKVYQSIPAAEAKATREDLILWPPLVIIHNSLFGDYSSTIAAKDVTVEGLEKILKDMGFGAGKAGVFLGKPGNQSIFIVKFKPTFSGFQEAERLHKHFIDKNHGKQEFQRSALSGKRGEGERQSKEVDEILYGYLAIAEDLDKLDPEIKKKTLVKSKKDDIEAIADAPLHTY